MSIDFSGVSLPFDAGDLLSSAMGFLQVVGPFVLLGLAIIFVPKIIGVIRSAAATRGKN
ncbi:hypothetical protein J27TS8_27470 [Robertmurraya siralis]|uniref:Uncharacterized protein n=1 Tax=Robertmurraya siralis TaxID=77777 RepID=A0A919WJ79_9BACI|nr:hypothetical protein [Robertmurraya siralis]GIN62754.1 hypothetical protein J27TS8_27470 [Robertmurraya siralis]